MKYTAKFERSEVSAALAALEKRELTPHEGFNRTNDGGWLIAIKDPSGETVGTLEVFRRAEGSKRSAYMMPDHEGQAIAFALAAQINRE